MSRRIDLLRLDYLFSVLIPLLVPIYLNGLNPFMQFDIIIGFFFLGITGNTWNDVFDMKNPEDSDTLQRVEGYRPKELFTIGLASFFLGFTLLLRTCLQNFPINFIFLVSIIIMVILYILWLKPIPIINQLFLAISHVILPYFIIKIDAPQALYFDIGELTFLLAFFLFAVMAQLVHEVIDEEAMRQHFSLRGCQIVIWIFSLLTLLFSIISFIFLLEFYFIPFLFVPLGTAYTFRRPKSTTKGVKDVGLVIGNLFLIYFLCLIILQMNGII
ncbi:MAG: conserved membrane protein of unknown function [Promethearchaeota archaeon]|nr:MAG: conserved membrane protein of unknown function [Candidatus Lokiarchaeota archaeon]